MSITGINEVMSKSDISESNRNELGKNDFLSLLVAQLENQDPLNPMDSTDFTAQLAQFSALEQMTNVNTNLGKLLEYQNSLNNSQALDYIGKSIKKDGNTIELNDGNNTDINFELENDAMNVNINIFDKYGNLVDMIICGSMDAGNNRIKWDGNSLYGTSLTNGTYSFGINANDIDGNPVGVNTFTTTQIKSVLYKQGTPYLVTEYNEFPIGDVIEVFE